MPGFTITTQDSLLGPDGDELYVLFENVLSARPDLKRYAALRFRQVVKRHPEPGEDGPELVLVFLEALDLDPPLTLVSSDLHLPGARGKGRGFG